MGCCHASSIGAVTPPDGGDKKHRRRPQPAPTKQQQQYDELGGQLPPDGGATAVEKKTPPPAAAAAGLLDHDNQHRDGRLVHFWHGLNLCHTSTHVAAVQTAPETGGEAGVDKVQDAAHGRSDQPQRDGDDASGERSVCSSSPISPMASPCAPLVTLTPDEPEDFYDEPAAKARQQQALPPSKWQFIFGGGRDNASMSAEGAYVASDSQQSPATARLTSQLLVRAQAARETRVKELMSTGRSVPEEELPPLSRNWRIECWMAAILKESASSSLGSYSGNRGGATGSALVPQNSPPMIASLCGVRTM